MKTVIENSAKILPVMESFYTIQGEGFHQGKAAYFIRLGGCDVGCVWCDVKQSWNAEDHPKKTVDEIIHDAVRSVAGKGISEGSNNGNSGSHISVVTGGEPLMHDCSMLTDKLQKAGFRTHIETSGAYPLSGNWDWICISPKKFKPPVPQILAFADELKVVIFNQSDFEWAEKYAALVPSVCKLYLQPEWQKSSVVTPFIIDYIKKNPRWEFSLQLHKYLNVP